MIREIEKRDHNAVCDIVSRNWRSVYNGFIDPLLLNDKGCAERSRELTADFASGRLTERVYEEDGAIIGMISFVALAYIDGNTADKKRRSLGASMTVMILQAIQFIIHARSLCQCLVNILIIIGSHTSIDHIKRCIEKICKKIQTVEVRK